MSWLFSERKKKRESWWVYEGKSCLLQCCHRMGPLVILQNLQCCLLWATAAGQRGLFLPVLLLLKAREQGLAAGALSLCLYHLMPEGGDGWKKTLGNGRGGCKIEDEKQVINSPLVCSVHGAGARCICVLPGLTYLPSLGRAIKWQKEKAHTPEKRKHS